MLDREWHLHQTPVYYLCHYCYQCFAFLCAICSCSPLRLVAAMLHVSLGWFCLEFSSIWWMCVVGACLPTFVQCGALCSGLVGWSFYCVSCQCFWLWWAIWACCTCTRHICHPLFFFFSFFFTQMVVTGSGKRGSLFTVYPFTTTLLVHPGLTSGLSPFHLPSWAFFLSWNHSTFWFSIRSYTFCQVKYE